MPLPTSGYTPGTVQYQLFVAGMGTVNIEVVPHDVSTQTHEDLIPALDAGFSSVANDIHTALSVYTNLLKTQVGEITAFLVDNS